MKILSAAFIFVAFVVLSRGAATDNSYSPHICDGGLWLTTSPIGQSFTALASNVHGGVYLEDEDTRLQRLSNLLGGNSDTSSRPYTIAPSVDVRIDLIAGEGTAGAVLHTSTRTLTAPFSGFVDVDWGAAGIVLTVGEKYSILITEVSGDTFPLNVTGWISPFVIEFSARRPFTDENAAVFYKMGVWTFSHYFGSYDSGSLIYASRVHPDEDMSFRVIDNAP